VATDQCCYAAVKAAWVRRVKVREVIKRFEDDGWYQVRMRGSHRQFKHSSKMGIVTVAGKSNVDIPPGTLNNILKQAGLKK
jgi:predicted RNA binding protein YcfA (HicA-like mRNA interferase family)